LTGCLLLAVALTARADESVEYRLKAAVLYNFARYTEWPHEAGPTLTLCILGRDPFGAAIDAMQGKLVGTRTLVVLRVPSDDALHSCHVLFIAQSAAHDLAHVIEQLENRPILTVADTPGAARQGVALNMVTTQDKVRFEANLAAARTAGLKLGANLLQLATLVIQ
jgi:hypothetical protein